MPVMWFHTMCCGALVRGIVWAAGPSVLLADFILRLALPGSSKGSEVRLGCGFFERSSALWRSKGRLDRGEQSYGARVAVWLCCYTALELAPFTHHWLFSVCRH